MCKVLNHRRGAPCLAMGGAGGAASRVWAARAGTGSLFVTRSSVHADSRCCAPCSPRSAAPFWQMRWVWARRRRLSASWALWQTGRTTGEAARLTGCGAVRVGKRQVRALPSQTHPHGLVEGTTPHGVGAIIRPLTLSIVRPLPSLRSAPLGAPTWCARPRLCLTTGRARSATGAPSCASSRTTATAGVLARVLCSGTPHKNL